MRVHICGVRGSTPAPGPEYVRYGGHTSCVAIGHGENAPTLVLDGGTGLQRLSPLLGGAPFRGSILLGHLHWDHTHGLPFFSAGNLPDSRVDVYLPAQGDAEAVIARAFSPPHFPVRLTELRGQWRITGLEAGRHHFEGFDVLARDIPHEGGRTFGFRVSDGSATLAYLSDHGPRRAAAASVDPGTFPDAALELANGADLLLHDAQHTAEEYPSVRHFGHSTIDDAVGLAEKAGVDRLLLYHHDPLRSDDALDTLVAEAQRDGLRVGAAAQGMVLDL